MFKIRGTLRYEWNHFDLVIKSQWLFDNDTETREHYIIWHIYALLMVPFYQGCGICKFMHSDSGLSQIEVEYSLTIYSNIYRIISTPLEWKWSVKSLFWDINKFFLLLQIKSLEGGGRGEDWLKYITRHTDFVLSVFAVKINNIFVSNMSLLHTVHSSQLYNEENPSRKCTRQSNLLSPIVIKQSVVGYFATYPNPVFRGRWQWWFCCPTLQLSSKPFALQLKRINTCIYKEQELPC